MKSHYYNYVTIMRSRRQPAAAFRVQQNMGRRGFMAAGIDYVQNVKPARISNEYRHFNDHVLKSAKVLEHSLSEFITRSGENLTTNVLLNQTKEIIVMSHRPMDTFRMLRRVRKYDDMTFIHSLNVAILCNAFGHWTDMPQEEVDILTMAGLLHDVGKMKIPEKIIKKPGSLTEEEFSVIKQHPQRGYQILKELPLDERIKKAALMHHERVDGKGYPSGLSAGEIDEFAKIVSIADMYDALTSARVYRGPLCPFEGFQIMKESGNERFDQKYLVPFLEGIAGSYVDSEVILSDGRKAVVKEGNPEDWAMPVVEISGKIVNLLDEKNIFVKEII